MTRRDEIASELRRILANDFNVPAEKIDESATFRGHMGLDSLDAVDLIYLLKKRFALEVRTHDFRDLHTVSQVVDFILAHTTDERRP